jgi:hypothetical protein
LFVGIVALVLQLGARKAKEQRARETSSTSLRDALVNPSKNEIFAAKHVPSIRERTSTGWTHGVLEQAGFQDGIYEGEWPPIENRELAHSNAKKRNHPLQKTESGCRRVYQSRKGFIPRFERKPNCQAMEQRPKRGVERAK